MSGLTRREFLASSTGVAAAMMAPGMARTAVLPPTGSRPLPTSAFEADLPVAWFDLALTLIRDTAGFSPPVASRAFAYAGVTLYEAVVPGMEGYRSLSGQLNDLGPVSGPSDRMHHWPTVANSALSWILRRLFPTAPSEHQEAMDALQRSFEEEFQRTVQPRMFRRSVRRGRNVARHIFEWSRSDGGHEAYVNNFPEYSPPVGPGLWIPTPPGFLPALQPYWGSNRPFVLASGARCNPGRPLTYSEEPASAFHAEAHECYQVVTNLTPEQEAIALFWSDDPVATFTPPGHWLSILTQVIQSRGFRLDVAAEAFAKVGMAVSDAFISCWRTKYRYNLLRPVTYIQRVIDPAWVPLLGTPPFPEYSSGHSAQSAAAAQVLTRMFGKVAFTDHTHDYRGLDPRSFSSFFDAAEEAAISRLYGGIHFTAAIERGLKQGRCVGRRVSGLRFRNGETED